MHEWALAESIITTVIREAEIKKLNSIKEIVIKIGELQQIEHDIFKFALDEVIKGKNNTLINVKIITETEQSTLNCKSCNHDWKFNDIKKNLNKDESESIHFIPEVAFVYTRCPKCGSPDFEIKTGRGISISSIKGER